MIDTVLALKRLPEAILQLFYPPDARCPGCGDLSGLSGINEKEDIWLCAACSEAFQPRFEIIRDAAWPADGIWQAYTAFRYSDIARSVIHSFKFRRCRDLCEPLAEIMGEVYRSVVMLRPDVIAPIPLHKMRERERGFNQSELLAGSLSNIIGVPCEYLLARTKRTRQQASLAHDKRAANTAGAFRAERNLDGQTVMLVDDVITSGHTANECAATLRAAGASEVWLIAPANASGNFDRA
jgi:ComF family protein